VLSRSVAIVGSGSITLPDFAVDLTLNSRNRALRVPLFTSLFEGVRNELVSTRITGTLASPTIGAEALSGTRRLIGSVFGAASATDGGLSEAEAVERIELESLRAPARGPLLPPMPQ